MHRGVASSSSYDPYHADVSSNCYVLIDDTVSHMYVCMYDGVSSMDGWMDGWIHTAVHVYEYVHTTCSTCTGTTCSMNHMNI